MVISSDDEEELDEWDEIEDGPAVDCLFSPMVENAEGGTGRM